MMKRSITGIAFLVTALVIFGSAATAQFKSDYENQPSSAQALMKQGPSIGNFFGLLSPENFAMHHSLSMNYLSSNAGGISLATYTNSMFFRIADPLDLRFDVTMMASPFGSTAGYEKSDYSKVFVSRAQLNYRPWENTSIHVEFNQIPFGGYGYYYRDRFAPSSFLWGDH